MSHLERLKRPITGILPMIRFALDQGGDTRQVLAGTGLLENDLLDSKKEIDLGKELMVIRNLKNRFPSPESAWHLGRYFNTRSHGALGSMIAAAPTVGDVISAIIDYSILSHSHFRLYPETREDRIRIYLVENHLPRDLYPFLAERDLMAGITIMETRLPGKKPDIILSIGFTHKPRTGMAEYRRVFIENIRFRQATTYFEIAKSSLHLSIPDGDRRAFELLRQQCQAEYSLLHAGHFSISDKVRLYLQEGKGNVPLPQIARKLNMSERSLRRQLHQEGANFRKIRNQYIFQQSLHLLQDPALRIEEISHALGYSETSSFTRSFQRWTGMSPGQYRKQHILS